MLLFFILGQTAISGPPKKMDNPGLPGCLAEVSELQNLAAVPQTGQTTSYHDGDDGDLLMGVPWPEPRFTDNEDGTVKDNLTNLIWLKNANCFGVKTWDHAIVASNNLADGECGLNDGSNPGDWHLPNLRELHSLVDYGNLEPALPTGHPFDNVKPGRTWSSTAYAAGPNYVWIMRMFTGEWSTYGKEGSNMVWPVRSDKD